MNNSKKFILVLVLLLLGASLIVTNAQTETKKSVDEKLGSLEGDVTSIVIKTDKGQLEFTGSEAEHLFKKMKADRIWVTASPGEELIELKHDIDSDKDGETIFIRKKHKGDFNWTGSMSEILEDSVYKKIKVESEDGVKKVTVTTEKDGEESTETYEGEEAEEFLDNMHDKHGMIFKDDDVIEIDSEDVMKSGGDEDVFIIRKLKNKDGDITIKVITGDDDDDIVIHKDADHDIHWITKDDEEGMEKEVNVEVKDGVKTVTVKTTEDGEEKVKVYTGDEADKYLEKLKAEERDLKSKKKKFKIEIEEEDDNDN